MNVNQQTWFVFQEWLVYSIVKMKINTSFLFVSGFENDCLSSNEDDCFLALGFL